MEALARLTDHLPGPTELRALWPGSLAVLLGVATAVVAARVGYLRFAAVAAAVATPAGLWVVWGACGDLDAWPVAEPMGRGAWTALVFGVAGAIAGWLGSKDRFAILLPFGAAAIGVGWIGGARWDVPTGLGGVPIALGAVAVILVAWAALSTVLERIEGPWPFVSIAGALGVFGEGLFVVGRVDSAAVAFSLGGGLLVAAFLVVIEPRRRFPAVCAFGIVGAASSLVLAAWVEGAGAPSVRVMLLPFLAPIGTLPLGFHRLREAHPLLRTLAVGVFVSVPLLVGLHEVARELTPLVAAAR